MRPIPIAFVLLASSVALADAEMPQFQSPPTKFTHKHEISLMSEASPVVVVDELLIGDVTNKELKFYFHIIGANGHICSGSGVATARVGAYYYIIDTFKQRYTDGKFWGEPVECQLRINIEGNHASLIDEEWNCKEAFCGMRAFIGETRFTRE